MKICLDTMVFVAACDGNAREGGRLQRRQQCSNLLRILFSLRKEVSFIVPSPVVAELMAARFDMEARQILIDDLREAEYVWSFDIDAAETAGAIARHLISIGGWPNSNTSREFMKSDCMIACVGLQTGCDVMCTYNRKDFEPIMMSPPFQEKDNKNMKLFTPDEVVAQLESQISIDFPVDS